jgi:plasmid stabilization system protein ParE
LLIDVHDEAREELIEARDFYDDSRSGYGLRFVQAIEAEFELLSTYPRIGKSVSRRARSHVVADWPYSVIYQLASDHIFIVAIAHHSKRPNYWRPRLR